MLKLPAVVTREIDGFLPAADAVKRGLVAKESPEPIGTVGQPLGGDLQARRGQAAPEAAGEHRRPRHGAEGSRVRALY